MSGLNDQRRGRRRHGLQTQLPSPPHLPIHTAVTGTRNFSCQAGGLRFGPAMGIGNATSAELECERALERAGGWATLGRGCGLERARACSAPRARPPAPTPTYTSLSAPC